LALVFDIGSGFNIGAARFENALRARLILKGAQGAGGDKTADLASGSGLNAP